MTTDVVMLVTRLSIVDWVYSKTQILLATLRTLNQLQVESHVSSEVETFVPISWMCKKQTSVSHSSTESDIFSLDAGLRKDGLFALDLWDIAIEVLLSRNNTTRQGRQAQGNLCTAGNHSPTEKSERDVGQLSDVDYVPTNSHSSQGESQLYIFVYNEAVIKMTIKGRIPNMRHVC